MKIVQLIILFLLSLFSLSFRNPTEQIPQLDNYLTPFVKQATESNCYCSTQNEFGIALKINRKVYPYRGEFAKKSKEQSMQERMKGEVLDSLNLGNYEASYYCTFWDPTNNSQKKKLIDVVITRLFNTEVEMVFTKDGINTVSKDLQDVLIRDQKHNITQFGKITTYPQLKSHWYQFSTYDTKLEQRNLGIYSQITHFFIWSGKTYSVTFNFDHQPTDVELSEMHIFFWRFGNQCVLIEYSQLQLDALEMFLRQYYSVGYDSLYTSLSEHEKNQVVSCSIEKIRQTYTYDEIYNEQFDEYVFDEITLGCIEFMKL